MEPIKAKYRKSKQARDGGQFAAIPHDVLNSRAYLSLGAYAVKLLFDLVVQFRGTNNGDLCASFSVMVGRGWKSKETLHNAKKQLLESGLVVETRKGMRPNKASLYAVTWHPLNECKGKLDMPIQSFPRGAYKRFEPKISPLKNTALSTVIER